MKKKRKNKSFLNRLAEANEASFGKQRLDCCDLKNYQNKNTVYYNDGGKNAKK